MSIKVTDVAIVTGADHLKWCKDRAYEVLDYVHSPAEAWASFVSDMLKHGETAKHPALALGMMRMNSGDLATVDEMRHFIEGFG